MNNDQNWNMDEQDDGGDPYFGSESERALLQEQGCICGVILVIIIFGIFAQWMGW